MAAVKAGKDLRVAASVLELLGDEKLVTEILLLVARECGMQVSNEVPAAAMGGA